MRLVWFLYEQVCKTCPSTSNRLTFLSILSQQAPHFCVYTVTTRCLLCFCENKFAKPAHPHPTASLFCLDRYNNCLTFVSIPSQHETCLVLCENLPVRIQPPHFSVSTELRNLHTLKIYVLCVPIACLE